MKCRLVLKYLTLGVKISDETVANVFSMNFVGHLIHTMFMVLSPPHTPNSKIRFFEELKKSFSPHVTLRFVFHFKRDWKQIVK